jgi:hypothetical protein
VFDEGPSLGLLEAVFNPQETYDAGLRASARRGSSFHSLVAMHPRRHAGDRNPFGHILCNHGAGPDDRTRANAAVLKDCRIGANESLFPDRNVP